MPACPVCGKPRQPDHRPFCSRRCADIDLGRWLAGAYVIPGETADADRAEAEAPPEPSPPAPRRPRP